ncbi:MAG: hypothetical protein KDA45_13410 [Planctomycetales bacterium]|nr:hypothetical protein [Planctomycetales bacterium]
MNGVLAASISVFSAIWFNRIWYSLPLIVVISLVYAATRHEHMRPILEHAVRFGVWVVVFMFIVFVVLMLLSFFV